MAAPVPRHCRATGDAPVAAIRTCAGPVPDRRTLDVSKSREIPKSQICQSLDPMSKFGRLPAVTPAPEREA
jgi:hypothetical protein